MRILVIEDNAVVRKTIELVLATAAHDVVGAMDGVSGLRLWRERNADLVLIDAHLDGRNGVAIAAELRASAPNVPIIMMSGDMSTELAGVRDANLLASLGRLTKPFGRAELLAVINAQYRPG